MNPLGIFMRVPVALVSWLLNLYSMAIFVRAIMSWVMPNPYNQFYQILIKLTEPVLGPIRRIVRPTTFDFSPLIAMVLIQLVIRALNWMLHF